MNVISVRLKNFGCHKDFYCDVGYGLCGIFGKNGSGKSTFVNSIYAALTNDFSRFDGVKADCVFDGASDGEQSFIELVAKHESVDFVLRRSIRPNKSTLELPGEKVITNVNEIENRLRTSLGVDMKLISTYVFVSQWQMFQFLDQTPAQRADAFKHLCRTEQSSVIHDAISKAMAKYQINADEVVDNSDELLSLSSQTQEEMDELNVEEGQLVGTKILNDKSLASASKIIKHCEALAELREDRTQLRARLKRIAVKLAKLQAVIIRISKKRESYKSAYDSSAQEVLEAKAALEAWKKFISQKKRVDLLNDTINEAEQTLLKLKEPKPPLCYPEYEDCKSNLVLLKQKRIEANDYVRDNKAKSNGICPTCKQTVDTKLYDKYVLALKELPTKIADLQDRITACETYDKNLRDYNTDSKSAKVQLNTAIADLSQYDNVLQKPDVDKAKLEALVSDQDALVLQMNKLRDLHIAKDKKLALFQGKRESISSQIKRIGEKIELYSASEPKFEKAKARKLEHDVAVTRIAVIHSLLTEKKKYIDSLLSQLKALKATKLRRDKITAACKTAGKVKELFHWSGLPNQVAQANLAGMEDDINETLSWFGNPFWVEADENLGFIVHMPGKTPKRAESLSGGQKAVLAIAFRVAVNTLFGTDIGMMWLDEPTAGLDDQNVEYFHDALLKLANEVRNKRQIAVITHASELKSAFDQVIEF